MERAWKEAIVTYFKVLWRHWERTWEESG